LPLEDNLWWSIIGRDPNDQYFPLAFVIVEKNARRHGDDF